MYEPRVPRYSCINPLIIIDFYRSCPLRVLVSLRVASRDFRGPGGPFWNVVGVTSPRRRG